MVKKTTTTTTVTTVIEDVTPQVKKTYVALVLDRSGSMSTIRDKAISLFNEQLRTLQTAPPEAGEMFATLVLFNDKIEVPVATAAPSRIDPLTEATYVPAGFTAMYDGMGRAISELRRFESKADDVAFLVVTVTDGEENASREYSGDRLSSLIRELKATGRWTFTVAGCNINVEALQNQLGIARGNIQAYASAADFGAGMVRDNNYGLANYVSSRSAGATNVDTFYEPTDGTTT